MRKHEFYRCQESGGISDLSSFDYKATKTSEVFYDLFITWLLANFPNSEGSTELLAEHEKYKKTREERQKLRNLVNEARNALTPYERGNPWPVPEHTSDRYYLPMPLFEKKPVVSGFYWGFVYWIYDDGTINENAKPVDAEAFPNAFSVWALKKQSHLVIELQNPPVGDIILTTSSDVSDYNWSEALHLPPPENDTQRFIVKLADLPGFDINQEYAVFNIHFQHWPTVEEVGVVTAYLTNNPLL